MPVSSLIYNYNAIEKHDFIKVIALINQSKCKATANLQSNKETTCVLICGLHLYLYLP